MRYKSQTQYSCCVRYQRLRLPQTSGRTFVWSIRPHWWLTRIRDWPLETGQVTGMSEEAKETILRSLRCATQQSSLRERRNADLSWVCQSEPRLMTMTNICTYHRTISAPNLVTSAGAKRPKRSQAHSARQSTDCLKSQTQAEAEAARGAIENDTVKASQFREGARALRNDRQAPPPSPDRSPVCVSFCSLVYVAALTMFVETDLKTA